MLKLLNSINISFFPMAPMSWLILFLLFSFSLILFTVLNYTLMSQSNYTDSMYILH